jgi:hypothetical protein
LQNLDSGPGMSKVYHCNVEIRGGTVVKIFKVCGAFDTFIRAHCLTMIFLDGLLFDVLLSTSHDCVMFMFIAVDCLRIYPSHKGVYHPCILLKLPKIFLEVLI